MSAQSNLEAIIYKSNLLNLGARDLLSTDEINLIIAERTVVEDKLNESIIEAETVINAIKYEMNLENTLKIRRKYHISACFFISDFSCFRRIHYLFKRAVNKFPKSLEWWKAWISFSIQSSNMKIVDKVCDLALTSMPGNEDLIMDIVSWRISRFLDINGARRFLIKWLQSNPSSNFILLEFFKFEILFLLRGYYGDRMSMSLTHSMLEVDDAKTSSSKPYDALINSILSFSPMNVGKIGKGLRIQTMMPDRHDKVLGSTTRPPSTPANAALFSSFQSAHQFTPARIYAEAINKFPSDVTLRFKFLNAIEASRSHFYKFNINLRSIHPIFADLRETIQESICKDFGTVDSCLGPAINLGCAFRDMVQSRLKYLSEVRNDSRLPPTYVKERNEYTRFRCDPFPYKITRLPKKERRIQFGRIYNWDEIRGHSDINTRLFVHSLSTGLFGGLVTSCEDKKIDTGSSRVAIIPISVLPRWILVLDIEEFGFHPSMSELELGTKASIPESSKRSDDPTHWVVQWVLPSCYELATALEDKIIFKTAEDLLEKLKELYAWGVDLLRRKNNLSEIRDFYTRFMNLLVHIMHVPVPCFKELGQWRVTLLHLVRDVSMEALQFEPTFIGARRLYIQTLCVLGRPTDAFINTVDSLTLMDSSSLRFIYRTIRNFCLIRGNLNYCNSMWTSMSTRNRERGCIRLDMDLPITNGSLYAWKLHANQKLALHCFTFILNSMHTVPLVDAETLLAKIMHESFRIPRKTTYIKKSIVQLAMNTYNKALGDHGSVQLYNNATAYFHPSWRFERVMKALSYSQDVISFMRAVQVEMLLADPIMYIVAHPVMMTIAPEALPSMCLSKQKIRKIFELAVRTLKDKSGIVWIMYYIFEESVEKKTTVAMHEGDEVEMGSEVVLLRSLMALEKFKSVADKPTFLSMVQHAKRIRREAYEEALLEKNQESDRMEERRDTDDNLVSNNTAN
jgi:U3 small nucleolar RNA-associated protein 6